jgi:hypothetical protein
MKKNPIYGNFLKKLTDTIPEKELISSILAFARSEST